MALVVQLHDGGEGQTVLTLIQGTDAIGELLGQHGDHRAGIVHRSTPGVGILVDGGAVGDIVAHIGDVDAQLIAVFSAGQGDGVVNILGVCRVDGEDDAVPQIQTLSLLLLMDAGFVDGSGFCQGLRRKLGGSAGSRNDGGGTVLGEFRIAEVLEDHGLVVKVAGTAPDQLTADLVALLGLEAVVLVDADGEPGALIRHYIQEAAVSLHHTGEDKGGLLHNLGDLAFGASVAVLAQAQQDGISGHGAHHPASGNEHIFLSLIGLGKAKGRVDLDYHSLDQGIRLFSQHELILFFPEFTPGNHSGNNPVKFRTIFPAQADGLADVLAGHIPACLTECGLDLGFQVGV